MNKADPAYSTLPKRINNPPNIRINDSISDCVGGVSDSVAKQMESSNSTISSMSKPKPVKQIFNVN